MVAKKRGNLWGAAGRSVQQSPLRTHHEYQRRLRAILSFSLPMRASMCIGVDYRSAGQRGPGSLVRAMQDEASAIWKEYAQPPAGNRDVRGRY